MAIIGAILGDIAGSQYEFRKPMDLDYKNCDLFTDKCSFTDDTVMTLAAKEAVMSRNDFSTYYRKFGRKYPDVGYGQMFDEWIFDNNAEAYGSYGNGSAMRVSYIGEYSNCQEEVIELATKSADCTHNHPEGIKGAVVTAMCIYLAKNGATKAEIYDYAKKQYPLDKYIYSVEKSIESYREIYRWDVTCQGSVPVAIRCFLESDGYESFLRNVFSLPCDMDTLCAIGGGIAEEYYKGTGFDNEKILKMYLTNDLFEIAKK